MDRKQTSWGHVADWYDSYMREEGTYQKDLILPNLQRVMEIRRARRCLTRCGQGSQREFAAAGATVTGVDSPGFIAIAACRLPIRFWCPRLTDANDRTGTFDKSLSFWRVAE